MPGTVVHTWNLTTSGDPKTTPVTRAERAFWAPVHMVRALEEVRPGRLDLDDIDGKRYTRDDFSGQVTLVNFWASWCPPCVEEIPSLNRLQQIMAGRPFELVSINYAEQRDTVIEFMQRVAVEFPVLLDSDGRYARDWKVISYPSTFVIDRDGVIRYGVNAAIEWDNPALVRKLEALLR